MTYLPLSGTTQTIHIDGDTSADMLILLPFDPAIFTGLNTDIPVTVKRDGVACVMSSSRAHCPTPGGTITLTFGAKPDTVFWPSENGKVGTTKAIWVDGSTTQTAGSGTVTVQLQADVSVPGASMGSTSVNGNLLGLVIHAVNRLTFNTLYPFQVLTIRVRGVELAPDPRANCSQAGDEIVCLADLFQDVLVTVPLNLLLRVPGQGHHGVIEVR